MKHLLHISRALQSSIQIRLNEHLLTMRPESDDSITGFNEAWDIVRDVFAHTGLTDDMIGAAPEMFEALQAIFEQLDNRYDGAPDSRTLWMGEHITRIAQVLKAAEGIK